MILETKRLILRPPRKEDWKDIMEGAGSMEIASMTAAIPHPYKKKDALWFINHSKEKWRKKKKKDYTFCIELKSEKKVIGATGIHKINTVDSKFETGSWINKKYWRKGYILEAKIPILDFGFNKLNLGKAETGAFVENKASQGMSLKIGFKKEGLKRKTIKCVATGKIHDEVVFGMLKNEWKKARPKILKSVEQKIKMFP